jgi:hypothetical protein
MIAFIREVAMFTCVLVLAGFITDWIKAIRWSKIPRWIKARRLFRFRLAVCGMCSWPFRPKYTDTTATSCCEYCMKILSRHD